MALFARANANAALLTNNCYLLKLTSHDVMLRSIANYTTKFLNPKKSLKCPCIVRSQIRHDLTSNPQTNFIRKCHVVPHNKDYLPFEELLARRRLEANRSILVQVQSPKSYKELYTYCEQFGTVNGMHHYTIKENMHFYLIEFNESLSAKAAMESATHVNCDEVIPVQSQMLWFRNARSTKIKLNTENLRTSNSPFITMNGSLIPENEELTKRLTAAGTISEQMILLHDAWKLDEVSIRLRFLTAHQLEQSFVGLFPRIAVFPFGSSVNGFGKRGCDLDLVLSLVQNQMEESSSRFVFHTKSISSDSKIQAKKVMETFADAMQFFVPGVSNVRRILQARVPIIKYDQTFTGLECDLSMTNMAAVYMSELLCFYGELDWRVRPLLFTIRQWAKNVGLTNPAPGRWITNFSIALLVLFYLQRREILPSLNTLKSLAGEADIRLTDHSVDCTFLRDVAKLPAKSITANTEGLETLLQGFFEYYSSFDFAAQAVSLRDGACISKPDFSPLYIVNPLEPLLNVSKNVNVDETERLKLALRNAAWMMETINDEPMSKRGIMSIFEQKLDVFNYTAGKRTVNVAALFKLPTDGRAKKRNIEERDELISDNEVHAQASSSMKIKKGRARRR